MNQPTADTTKGPLACPVCAAATSLLDVVDLNKSCEEARGKFLPVAGVPIYYTLCDQCGFCFAPEMYRWSIEDFSNRIYNDDYRQVDPDYLDARPHANAQMLAGMFAKQFLDIRHLDYGGGNGVLSSELFAAGWNSTSYDPFVDGPLSGGLGKFNLVTSFEVFEHVPDVKHLMATLSSLVEEDGMVLFSTLLSDGILARNQRVQWWYASPRNGHISLFSRRSLALLGEKEGFDLVSFSPNLHAFWRNIPSWAADVFKPA
jgi:SAM-dependent methyltransferase